MFTSLVEIRKNIDALEAEARAMNEGANRRAELAQQLREIYGLTPRQELTAPAPRILGNRPESARPEKKSSKNKNPFAVPDSDREPVEALADRLLVMIRDVKVMHNHRTLATATAETSIRIRQAVELLVTRKLAQRVGAGPALTIRPVGMPAPVEPKSTALPIGEVRTRLLAFLDGKVDVPFATIVAELTPAGARQTDIKIVIGHLTAEGNIRRNDHRQYTPTDRVTPPVKTIAIPTAPPHASEVLPFVRDIFAAGVSYDLDELTRKTAQKFAYADKTIVGHAVGQLLEEKAIEVLQFGSMSRYRKVAA